MLSENAAVQTRDRERREIPVERCAWVDHLAQSSGRGFRAYLLTNDPVRAGES